jgi:hypothetical protein
MPILDYSTKVSVAKTVAEIESKLAKAKAEAILKEYDSDRIVSAFSFRIRIEFGVLTFLLTLLRPASNSGHGSGPSRVTRLKRSLSTCGSPT